MPSDIKETPQPVTTGALLNETTNHRQYTALPPVPPSFTLVPRREVSPVLSPSPKAGSALTSEDELLQEVLLAKARKLLKPCPDEGGGVHRWTFYAAKSLIECGLSDEQAQPLIEALTNRTRGDVTKEISDALKSAREERKPGPRWSPVNPRVIAALVENEPTTLRDLIARSPEPIDPAGRSRMEFYIDTLFPGNPLLCLGETEEQFYTERWEKWRTRVTLPAKSLIVPSPMTAERGRTKAGYLSFKSEDNTGPRRFLVVEFDKGSLDQQAALLSHLGKTVPLALVVFSGGKSLHGWVYCAGQLEGTLFKFFDRAVELGADRATWTRSQFVRIPDGTRNDGKTSTALSEAGIEDVPDGRQAVLYFNPSVIAE